MSYRLSLFAHPVVQCCFVDKKWRVPALIIVWIVFGAANLLRAGMATYIATALVGYPLSLSLPLLKGVYGVWGMIFLAAAVVTWRRQSTGSAPALALAYQATLWLLHLLGDRSAYARSLWPRDVFLTLVFLALIVLLAGRKKSARQKM